MSDPIRKQVNNPLFNAAVTGSTFEEFSQNAILLPAREVSPAPPPVLDLNPSVDNPPFQEDLEELSANIEQFLNQTEQSAISYLESNYPQPGPSQPTQQTQQSNLTSVFSTFSSILKLGGQQENRQSDEVPPPAGIQDLIGEQTDTGTQLVPLFTSTEFPNQIESVPLFSTTSSESIVEQPPSVTPEQQSTETINTFRQPRHKRRTYAHVPGLSSSVNSNPIVQQENYRKLVNPESSGILNPTIDRSFVQIFQSPVMAAIPANDANLDETITRSPSSTSSCNEVYRPVYHHWFHKKEVEGRVLWQPFSMADSLALEEAFVSNDLDPKKVVPTDGGRFDVDILRRERIPVYWTGKPTEVRRCSWFHKGQTDGRYVPYEENIATKLEEEYKTVFELNQWNRKVELPCGGTVVFHAPDMLVLFQSNVPLDPWGNSTNQTRPRIVKRGMDEFDFDEGEPPEVDHLLFLVHGIGSVCDLKFRSVEEVVDEFRSVSLQLIQSHYRSSCDKGVVHRVEVLPISWHQELHSEETGIDKKLKSITLESIPRLRDFTNDTLLDILFYTSPVYCQTVISTVGNQLNRVYNLFKQRNPTFNGGVSLGGHSLGSLILFDLLCHQHVEQEKEAPVDGEDAVSPLNEKPAPPQRRISRRISYMMSSMGTGQPQLYYPHLMFQPTAFFALGSPIGMFVTVRGLDTLGEYFALPTCPAFFNIFHPYDPVAYRVESLINPELAKLKPVLIPHHKGRKRMHLELKETMARVGADLKQRVVDSFNSFYQLAMFHRPDPPEKEIKGNYDEPLMDRDNTACLEQEQQEERTDKSYGLLNKHRRIDYVLQEAPFEIFNEYIFALSSHVCYWESEDTMLLILKEIYGSMNISPDDKIPQRTMTIERPTTSKVSSNQNNKSPQIVVDPTMPIQQNINIGPPPTSGFVSKT